MRVQYTRDPIPITCNFTRVSSISKSGTSVQDSSVVKWAIELILISRFNQGRPDEAN